jgi:hypothetical protein
MNVPDVHYARSGDVAIAYQVVGDGPVDLVFVPWLSNLAYAGSIRPSVCPTSGWLRSRG